MPNPVPLATKEEEERRAWVTQHHEVVRLAKDCFGDRFSNNEIFDRLKISRRTGYRALTNDERIGKAPGRKPKITEETIKEMIKYIEDGGCSDVGNVWKHLAEKFAPDCNPKTVQDAVKKSGFKNFTNQVKLDSLLQQTVPENQLAPNEEAHQRELQADHTEQTPHQLPHAQQPMHHAHAAAIDPVFSQHTAPDDVLRGAIQTAPLEHIRWMLTECVLRLPEAASLTSQYLCPFAVSHAPPPPPITTTLSATLPGMAGNTPIQTFQIHQHNPVGPKRRIAICRRCGQQYDRNFNNMETRECLYHKGSPQKISNEEGIGSIDQSPEAYIWSCCGGNGMVRGCCRAMHTTKKKRKYSRKRSATDAGLDDEDAASGPDDTDLLGETELEVQVTVHDPNLTDLHTQHLAHLPELHEGLDGGEEGQMGVDEDGEEHWKPAEQSAGAYDAASSHAGKDMNSEMSEEARMQVELQQGMQQEFSQGLGIGAS